jgi:hypothetical protein
VDDGRGVGGGVERGGGRGGGGGAGGAGLTAIPKVQQITYSTKLRKLIAEKRRARSIWQRTHTQDSRRTYNRTRNKLKSKLQEMRNEPFENMSLI